MKKLTELTECNILNNNYSGTMTTSKNGERFAFRSPSRTILGYIKNLHVGLLNDGTIAVQYQVPYIANSNETATATFK